MSTKDQTLIWQYLPPKPIFSNPSYISTPIIKSNTEIIILLSKHNPNVSIIQYNPIKDEAIELFSVILMYRNWMPISIAYDAKTDMIYFIQHRDVYSINLTARKMQKWNLTISEAKVNEYG